MPSLPRTLLGRTGLEVTTLGFGAMELRGPARGGPALSDADAERVLNAVLDAGINFIDTSPDYGLSEERIGRYIAHRRGEYYLASKCGCAAGEFATSGEGHIFTAANVRAGVEQSLRRMRTDYLDLVQFHGSPTRAQLETGRVIEELRALQAEGKVRFIGMSSTLPDLRDHLAMGVFDEFQIPYSAIQREHEAVIAAASAAGAGIAIRGGAARGTPADWEHRQYYMMPGTMPKDRWELAKLDEILDGMSRMEFTLRFTLSNPHLDTTIVGTKDVGHLEGNVALALKGPLPADVVAEAKRRLDAVGLSAE